MIKQIWFIRNERKLINSLSFTIVGFIFLYSLLSIWALSDALLDSSNQNVYQLMFGNAHLIILPLVSLLVSSVLFWFSNHTKASKNCFDKQSIVLEQKVKRDLLIGTNLFLTLVISFVQIEFLNYAKQISGFGLTPIYICIVGVTCFYVFTIFKFINKK